MAFCSNEDDITQQHNRLFSKLFYRTGSNLPPDFFLFGSEFLDNYNNIFIFQYVHDYIKNTGRLKICANISNNV